MSVVVGALLLELATTGNPSSGFAGRHIRVRYLCHLCTVLASAW